MKMDPQHHSLASSGNCRKLLDDREAETRNLANRALYKREEKAMWGTERGPSLCSLVGSCVACHQAARWMTVGNRLKSGGVRAGTTRTETNQKQMATVKPGWGMTGLRTGKVDFLAESV